MNYEKIISEIEKLCNVIIDDDDIKSDIEELIKYSMYPADDICVLLDIPKRGNCSTISCILEDDENK